MIFRSPRARRTIRPVHPRFRPQVHALEDRCLLSAVITNFPLPDAHGFASAITSGPDGNVWFTDTGVHKIGRITPTGTITEFNLPANSNPVSITSGLDGNLWFTDNGLDQIGRITPAGAITEYLLPAAAPGATVAFDGAPADIVTAADGNLWFTLANRTHLGRLSTSGIFTNFDLGSRQPDHLTAGRNGNLWFIDRSLGLIEQVTFTGEVTIIGKPSSNSGVVTPVDITAGSDGNLWFVEGSNGNQIGQVTPFGGIFTFDLPPGHTAFGIRLDANGNLWFTEQGGVGRLDPRTGILAEFALPAVTAAPFTFGPDGNLWLANGNTISKLDIGALPPVDVTNVSLNQILPLLEVSVVFTATPAPSLGSNASLTIDWGDGNRLDRTLTLGSTTSNQVLASHTYDASGPLTVQVSIAQAGSLIQVTLHSVLALASGAPAPGTSYSGTPFSSSLPGGRGGGYGSVGDVPWVSPPGNGLAGAQGAPAGGAAILYAAQPMESLTSVPPSRPGGYFLFVTLQISGGVAQVANAYSPAPMQTSSGSGRLEAPSEVPFPVTPRTVQGATSVSAGADNGFGSTPDTNNRATAQSGVAPDKGATRLPASSPRGGEKTAQGDSESQVLALIGEPLLETAPGEQDLLAIARDILASDGQSRQAVSTSLAWLEPSLAGVGLALVLSQPVIWSIHFVKRRREMERLVPVGR